MRANLAVNVTIDPVCGQALAAQLYKGTRYN